LAHSAKFLIPKKLNLNLFFYPIDFFILKLGELHVFEVWEDILAA
jgi:hypothetical protein